MPLFYNYGPPSVEGVIQNGLVLNLDASYTSSYPKTGTNWIDISGRNLNFDLINGPAFQLVNEGVIRFDGTNDWAGRGTTNTGGITGSLNNFTVNAWFNLNTVPPVSSNAYTSIFTQQLNFNFSNRINFAIGNMRAESNRLFYGGYFDGNAWVLAGGTAGGGAETGIAVIAGTWYNTTLTYDLNNTRLRLYLNGRLYAQTNNASITSAGVATNAGYAIAKRWDSSISGPNGSFIDGRIPVVNVYNRELSADEVQFNYDTLKGRYT